MEQSRINNILSIQNLSSVNHPNQIQTPVNHQFNQQQFLQLQMQMHLHLQQQQQLQLQQQQQQLQHQQQQHQQQQQHHNQNHHQRNQHRHQRNNNNGNNNNNHLPILTNGRPNHLTSKKELIDLVTCKLCKGYLIDAATLDLCMHSFCRTCAVRFIREKPRCPECNVEIKDKRFLNRLKTDRTIQSIVYKLVPGLYEKEMARRRKFYADRPSSTPRFKCEMFGDIPLAKTIKPDDMLNVGLTWKRDGGEEPIKTYLYCRADSTMLVLRKLIIGKFGLERPIKIYYENNNSEIFFDFTTIMDVAATFEWSTESKILNLYFKEEEEGEKIQSNSSPPTSFGPDL